MTAAATFDEVRRACAGHNRACRHEEALARAEEACRRFPEHRDFAWFLVACAHPADFAGRIPGPLADAGIRGS